MVDEIQKYLELERKQFPAYYNKLTDVSAQMGDVPIEASVFVLIPVHSSERHIERLLENYSHQTLDSEKFEVILFLNRTTTDSDFSTIKKGIETFRKQSSMHISILEYEFSNRAPIGLIRKIVNDACLVRGASGSTLLVNNDADSLFIKPEYLEEILALHVGKDLLTTQSQHYDDTVYEIPIFGEIAAIVERIEGAYGAGLSQHAFVSAWCGNLVTNATAYARMGGFDPAAFIGEELVFVYFFVRTFGEDSFKRTNPHITTSCRRIAHNFIQRHAARDMYADFFTADIRSQKEHAIHKSVRQAAEQCNKQTIMERLAGEFVVYLEKLSTSMPDRKGVTAEKRLNTAIDIFKKVLFPLGFQIVPGPQKRSVTFLKDDQSFEMKIQGSSL